MSFKLRKRRINVPPTGSVPDLVRAINEQLDGIAQDLSQVDAIGQNPDMKGQNIKNLGNLKNVAAIATPATATTLDCAEKINEILAALK